MSWPVGGMIAHGLPVVSAFGAGAGLHPFFGALLHDFVAVVHLAGLLVDLVEDVLEDRLLVASRNLPVLRSSFQRMPSLPMVNSRFWPPESTSTRS